MQMIQIQQVYKRFDDLEAVNNFSLRIEKGSIYGLLGSNGAGKTTLLKLIAGIYKPDSGNILIDGQPVFENVHIKQRTMFVADALYFFPNATITQMANFYKSIYTSWNDERFQKLQSAFPLNLHKRLSRMSKGMQRQAAFLLVLSAMPDVLILDEPLDGLDAVMRQKVRNLLVQDVAEREMTVLISSHNLREVEDLCDHISIMHDGKILIEKDLDDLKSDIHKIQVAWRGDIPAEFINEHAILYKEERGSVFLYIIRGDQQQLVQQIEHYHPLVFDILPLTLEEIFIYEMGDIGYAIENIMV